MSRATTGTVAESIQGVDPFLHQAWHAFDRIYCISLNQRLDRRHAATREFHRVGLIDRVQFVLVDKHPTDSEQGIFESHMSCLRAGLDAGAERILIFEDDIRFLRFTPRVLEDSIYFMKSSPGWDLFFFGCFVKSSRKTPFRSVLQLNYRCAAHAYVAHRSIAERLVKIPWSGVAYDDLLRSIENIRCHACYPAFAFQGGSASDNSKTPNIGRFRRICGFGRLQRWDEFSKHHARALILGHVAVVLLIVLLALAHHYGRL